VSDGEPLHWRAFSPERRKQLMEFRERLLKQGWQQGDLNYPGVVRRLRGALRLSYRNRVADLIQLEVRRGTSIRFLADSFCTQTRVLQNIRQRAHSMRASVPPLVEDPKCWYQCEIIRSVEEEEEEEEMPTHTGILEEWLSSVQ
jgi:hypothetical protein